MSDIQKPPRCLHFYVGVRQKVEDGGDFNPSIVHPPQLVCLTCDVPVRLRLEPWNVEEDKDA